MEPAWLWPCCEGISRVTFAFQTTIQQDGIICTSGGERLIRRSGVWLRPRGRRSRWPWIPCLGVPSTVSCTLAACCSRSMCEILGFSAVRWLCVRHRGEYGVRSANCECDRIARVLVCEGHGCSRRYEERPCHGHTSAVRRADAWPTRLPSLHRRLPDWATVGLPCWDAKVKERPGQAPLAPGRWLIGMQAAGSGTTTIAGASYVDWRCSRVASRAYARLS